MPGKISSDFFSSNKPTAIIVGDNFIAKKVSYEFIKRGVNVIWINSKKDVSNLNNENLDNLVILNEQLTSELLNEINKANYILSFDNSKEELELLLNLAKNYKAKFLFTNKKASQDVIENIIKNSGVDARFLELGDIYGSGIEFSPDIQLHKILSQYLVNNPIKISENEKIYPLHINSAVEGIIKAIFVSGTKGKIIFLSEDPITQKELVQLLNTENFIIESNEPSEDKRLRGEHWQTESKLAEDLNETIEALSIKTIQAPVVFEEDPVVQITQAEVIPQPEINLSTQAYEDEREADTSKSFWETKKLIQEKVVEKQTAKQDKPKKKVSVGDFKRSIILSLTIIALPIFWLFILPFIEVGVGAYELQLAKKALERGDSEKVQTFSTQSVFWLTRAHESFLRWEDLPLLNNSAKIFTENAKIMLIAAKIAESSSKSLDLSKELVSGIVGKDAFNLQDPVQKLAFELKNIERDIAFLQAESDKLQTPGVFSTLKELKNVNFSFYRQAAAGASELLPLFPELLGEKEKKTYLLLFQNNMELRPTGGFIGSFALITFEKGRMTNFEVQDVYSADGQLNGHVEPPEQIRKYLGEGNWYLRDSNWSPDFPTSAARAAWFLDKELSKKVNGVIAIDLEFVKGILAETGPIELEDFGETITAENLYEKAQGHAEVGFFPGSTAKKDFLTALARKLLTNLTENPEKLQTAVGKSLVSSLKQKHVLAWSDNAQANTILNRAGWDGSILNLPCKKSADHVCISDYLQIVEANLGVNKSNYFLERSSTLDISINGDNILHKLTINYQNSSQAGVWPGGDYKNYLRVYTTQGSQNLSFIIVDSKTGQQEAIAVDNTIEKGKTVFGGLVVVPSQSQKQVVIEWQTSASQPESLTNGEYVLLWQKQAGIQDDPILVTITTPDNAAKTRAYPQPLLTTTRLIRYNTQLQSDFVTNILWEAE